MTEQTPTHAGVRADLVDVLRRELLGPEEENEEIPERATLRYLVGRLAPAGTALSPEEDDSSGEATSDEEDSDVGASSALYAAMNPSSIGLSANVASGVRDIAATASWGDYSADERTWTDEAGKERKRTVHHRTPRSETIHIPTDPTDDMQVRELAGGINIEWVCRELADGGRALSVFLVNRREPADATNPDEPDWIFQPQLRLSATDKEAVFEARRLTGGKGSQDHDVRTAELLYWNRPEYAVGHGCAAEWTAPADTRENATEVWTEIVPAYELPRVDPREDVPANLDMRGLGGAGPEGVPATRLREMLTPLADAYDEWIEGLRNRRGRVVDDLQDIATDRIQDCESASKRIRAGIQLITQDRLAREAFCFANRAMGLQRERTEKALARRRGEPDPTDVPAEWRPFQIAFILMSLCPIVDRSDPDRRVADLLWFPTGGGKTEAYLGLTAFALAHRRLREPLAGYSNEAGVTVLMRYTLRLLTIQQFQRATTLILACEHLRRTEGTWGSEPFSIGLWVGRAATPNQYTSASDEKGAKEAVQRIKEDKFPREGSPRQLLSCPWCGTDLPIQQYDPVDDEERVRITCPDEDCEFSQTRVRSMPVHVVDEEVYRHVPSLVIATVDKFARMPWNGRTKALFGMVSRHCPRHGYLTEMETKHPKKHRDTESAAAAEVTDLPTPLEPPDLIIQDELHLISGPLGTLMGTYEAAVDILASPKVSGTRIPPKIIASTATIRRADEQVGALFARSIQIFPPSGLEARDSWFGVEVSTDKEPGRLYVGVCAPGKSVKTALVRVYANLLARARAHLDVDEVTADGFMTLVGYFNSLRELGGALRLVEDDIPGRMDVLSRRDKEVWPYRDLYENQELTSNKRAEQIPAILSMLERRFHTKPESGNYPVDTLLASNMISVGVDIDRLGLMVVNGQPKTTSEYIQATSRVGRRTPGLVVTVYNWTRPRDLSHYERFRSYHGMLYRFVEATSVTPFSSRSRDRALEGVLTALLRLGDPDLTPEQAADLMQPSDPWVAEVVEALAERAETVAPIPGYGASTRGEIQRRLDEWRRAADSGDLCYTAYGLGRNAPADKRYLLGSAEGEHDGVFEAPGSLREVESEIHVYLPSGSTNP